jgi:hypothetical protein
LQHLLQQRKGMLRGAQYFQAAPFGKVKIIRCTAGAVHEVTVDLRPDSLTYRAHAAVTLSAANPGRPRQQCRCAGGAARLSRRAAQPDAGRLEHPAFLGGYGSARGCVGVREGIADHDADATPRPLRPRQAGGRQAKSEVMNRALLKQAMRSTRIWPSIAAGEARVLRRVERVHRRADRMPSAHEEPCIVLENVVYSGAHNADCLRAIYVFRRELYLDRVGGRTIDDRCDVRGRDTERPLCRLGGLWVIRAPASCPRRKGY